MQIRIRTHRQAGMSTIASVAALSGVMVLFLIIFLIANSGGSKTPGTTDTTQQNNSNNDNGTDDQTDTTEPAFIRIPQNSLVYANKKYGFSFAYPDSFQNLSESSNINNVLLLRVESAFADKKPVGNTGATLNGQLVASVYSKASFRIIVAEPDTYAGPTKTGNDTTWKIVATDSANTITVGAPYNTKTVKSQAGVTVFDMPYKSNNLLQGRLVFEADDYYVLISLPFVTLPNNAALSTADVAAYNIILSNIAKTVRVFDKGSANSNTDTTESNSSNTNARDSLSGN